MFQTEEPDYSLLEEGYPISNRDSFAYRKAHTENKFLREEASKKDETPLTASLLAATHITPTIKEKYAHMASVFLEDMRNNIFRNQFELEEEYPTISADEWNDFLNDRIVSTYLSRHKRTLLKSAAEDNLANPLAKNKRDNLKLIENIEREEQGDKEKNILIIRIPDIYEQTS